MAKKKAKRIRREFTPDERKKWEQSKTEEAAAKPANIKAARKRKEAALIKRNPLVVALLQSLAAEKESQGLSYADLQERTGIERSSLARILNNGTNPKLLTLETIAKAMGKELQVKVK